MSDSRQTSTPQASTPSIHPSLAQLATNYSPGEKARQEPCAGARRWRKYYFINLLVCVSITVILFCTPYYGHSSHKTNLGVVLSAASILSAVLGTISLAVIIGMSHRSLPNRMGLAVGSVLVYLATYVFSLFIGAWSFFLKI